ncbi:MAG: molybdate ABC transporter substrate-binding protein [Chloroflexi bacterium]|nr:molybdate ABC transporter substrate-binding protein [Chloroflexota bacterium]
MLRRSLPLLLTGLALLAACGASPTAPPVSPATTVATSAPAPTAPPTPAPATAVSAAPVTLNVFAPAALTEASRQLGAAFEAANAGVTVAFELGHSPTQRAQLEQGATPDVFISASRKDMDLAAEQQLVVADQVQVFARNKLIVILPPDNPAQIESLADLAKPGVQLLIGTPDIPIGSATLSMLDKLNASIAPDFKARVLANVVSQEVGVKPIVSKVSLGEADAGIVYVSDAVAAPTLTTLAIPDEANVIVVFTIAPVTAAPHPEEAAAFVASVLAPEGQAVLTAQGFLPAGP